MFEDGVRIDYGAFDAINLAAEQVLLEVLDGAHDFGRGGHFVPKLSRPWWPALFEEL